MYPLDFRMQLLLSLSREISGTLEQDRIFKFLSASLKTFFPQVSWIGLFRCYNECNIVEPVVEGIKHKKIMDNIPLFKKIYTTREYIFIENIHETKISYTPFHEDTKSVLWMPIIRWGKVEGFLGIETRTERGLKLEDILFTRIIADYLGVAFSNIQLFKENEERMKNFETAYEVSLLTSKPLEKKELIKNFLRIITEKLNCIYSAFFERKKELLELVDYYAVRPEIKPVNLQIPVGEGLVGKCAQSGEVLLEKNIEKSPFYKKGIKGIKSELVIPVFLEKEIIGCLDLGRKEEFSREFVTLGQLLSNTLSISLQRAAHFKVIKEFASQMEIRVKEKTEELIKSEKFAVIGRMTSILVHELRNILAGITSMADLITMKVTDEKTKELARVMKEEAENATKQLNNILNFVKPIKLNYDKGNIIEIVDRAIEISKPSFLEKDIALVRKYEERIPPIMMDTERIKEVFVNLIINAAQAIEKKGEIKIELQEKDGYCIFSIKDTGSGIAKEDMNKIFEPFFTRKIKGTGIGLAQVKKILDYHGWEIAVESEIDKGTAFSIKVPLPKIETFKKD